VVEIFRPQNVSFLEVNMYKISNQETIFTSSCTRSRTSQMCTEWQWQLV